jgi:hypothetical protein
LFFTFPFAFLASLAIPALVAIYWLRSRHRRQPVSSLILWLDHRETKEGGRIVDRLQMPLLFFLELLTIVLLILAAAGPRTNAGSRSIPLIVILDDSFSMLALGPDSFRDRAIASLERELHDYNPVQFVLAGEKPRVLSEPVDDAERAIALLDQWKCLSPSSNIEEALAFASSLDPPRARVIVITDRPPTEAPADSRVQWWAFGATKSNVAFVNAARTEREEETRCFLEVANLSTTAARTELLVEIDPASEIDLSGEKTRRSVLELAANETRRIVVKLPSGAGTLKARLEDDSLTIDNEVILLPEPRENVRVVIDVQDSELRKLVEKALAATKDVELVQDRPELRITDYDAIRQHDSQSWILKLIADAESQSYLGPFVVNRSHPLTEGLSLGGVVWGAGKNSSQSGAPVIAAGDVLLLTDLERPDGTHEVQMQLRPRLSTVHETPNWPILIWNLIDWRAASAPGIRDGNLRLGAEAIVNLRPGTLSIRMITPEGKTVELPVQSNTQMIQTDSVGVYELKTSNQNLTFAVNALNSQESDLRGCGSGSWGDANPSVDGVVQHRNWSWAFLLMAIVVMAVHVGLISKRK